MTRKLALLTYRSAADALANPHAPPECRDLGIRQLVWLVKNCPFVRINRLARERLQKVATATDGFQTWGGAA